MAAWSATAAAAAAAAAAAKREQRMDGSRADGRSDGRKEARLAAANAFTIAAVASRCPLLLLDPRPTTTTYDYECVNIVRKVEWAMPGSVALPSA